MAFTKKYLERLNVDELKELLGEDEAELSDAEKERINEVIGEKAEPSNGDGGNEDDALVDRIADRFIEKLTAAEKIADAAARGADDDGGDGGGGDDGDGDGNGDGVKPKKNAKPKGSLAARFHGQG